MAVRRKVFRIELGLRAQSSAQAAVCPADIARMSRELEAIVVASERAALAVLQAAEEIDRSAGALCAALGSGPERGLADGIRGRVARIFEACNFQDLAGQRVGKVTAALALIERHVGALGPAASAAPADDRRFLNGPRLAGEPGHSTQAEVDALFARRA